MKSPTLNFFGGLNKDPLEVADIEFFFGLNKDPLKVTDFEFFWVDSGGFWVISVVLGVLGSIW